MKSLTIFRHGAYNQYYQLKEDSAIQIYQTAKNLLKYLEKPKLILSSDILRAQQTADVIGLATQCHTIRTVTELEDINFHLTAHFKAGFLTDAASLYQNINHIIIVTHEPNTRALLHRDLHKGEFITLQATYWEDIFTEEKAPIAPCDIAENNYICSAQEITQIQKILTYV